MKVIELINKLEQFNPTADVRFEHIEKDENGKTSFIYMGCVIEDVEHVPNEACNIVTLLPEQVVRQRLHNEIQESIKTAEIGKLRKIVLAFKTKVDDWMK